MMIHVRQRYYAINRPLFAFCGGALIGTVGGMIGLGGAEFRLPLLITVFALYPHRAVRINLLISFSTLAFAAISRFGFTDTSGVQSYLPIILLMVGGGMISAWIGAGVLEAVPREVAARVIAALLLIVALVLGMEAVFPLSSTTGIGVTGLVAYIVAAGGGLAIGAISSLLGVAGGEFIIPFLALIFGADIKTAGTMSVLISTPLVLTGVTRHIIGGKFRSQTLLVRLVIPMSAGSIVGAMLGGYAALWAPVTLLKAVLAAVLLMSSWKLVREGR